MRIRLFKSQKAQSTAEYAIVFAVVVGVAIAMQTYVKRSLQGGVKYAVDNITVAGGHRQYEPYYLETANTQTVDAYTDTEQTNDGGGVDRVYASADDEKTTTRSGYQKIKSVATQQADD